MKKCFLLLVVLLIILPSVISSYGVTCYSDDSTKTVIKSSVFEDSGNFTIVLGFLLEGDISVEDVTAVGILVIDDYPKGPIPWHKDIHLSGTYSPDRHIHHTSEKIIINYTDQSGSKNEAIGGFSHF